MKSCVSSSRSSSSISLLAETSLGYPPPCIRAVSVPFVWRVPNAIGTVQCPACSSTGRLKPRAARALWGRDCAQGSHRSVWAAAGFAPRKHMHFWSLSCPGVSVGSSPFPCDCPDTLTFLCCMLRAWQLLCPSRALGDGEAFSRVERGKDRARQLQLLGVALQWCSWCCRWDADPCRGQPWMVLSMNTATQAVLP